MIYIYVCTHYSKYIVLYIYISMNQVQSIYISTDHDTVFYIHNHAEIYIENLYISTPNFL